MGSVWTVFEMAWRFTGALWRDFIAFLSYVRFQVEFKKINIFRETLVKQFDALVEEIPNKTAIIYNGQRMRFIDLYHFSNKVAHWMESSLDLGLDDGKLPQIDDGNTGQRLQQPQIGLMLGNTPELVGFLVGIAKVRATSVLFNTNNRRDCLLNAFDATNCKVIVFDRQYLEAIREVASQLPEEMKFFMYDRVWQKTEVNNNQVKYGKDNFRQYEGMTRGDLMAAGSAVENLAPILDCYPETSVQKKYSYELSDNITYVFTSGTTGGAVKATPTNNVRYIVGHLSQEHAFGFKEQENIYICLPLYHSYPGIVGLGRCLMGGNTITLAEKFSARRFWSDCKQNQCTVALYIGEICRYLLAQPRTADETSHGLRMMHGLGLKKEIWKEFRDRFKIKKISEFYGSSEGNINLFNISSTEGACGFIPYYFGPLARLLFPIYLIKVDPVTLEPIRSTKTGLCKIAGPGDVGLVIGQIRNHLSYTQFLGYTSEKETSKKILKNILSKGDYAFVSGDLMELDLYGNLYFKDRTGDTFRWKGENVSTTEIEAIAAQYLQYRTVCTVYGVGIPFTDGRAGMIAIKSDTAMSSTELAAFYQYLRQRVPEYAIPKFIRFTPHIETTSTHKLIKYRLREEGFNLRLVGPDDRLYWFDKSRDSYQPLTEEIFQLIQQGLIRF